ncbi:MAG: murein biosynthesis integral membrane protein MurJ [Persicimonas sp.]
MSEDQPSPEAPKRPQDDTAEPKSAASFVAVGILASRIFGLVRERAIAYFFGVSAHADVWQFVSKAPNILQNLLGEGTISASFIPVYSRMIDDGRHEDAGRLAGAIFGLLLAVAAVLTLLGIVFAGPIVTVLAPGFAGDAALVAAGEASFDRFELAVRAVRIMFPMAGVLVLAAWALAILNSHRRFLLPYLAPVLWNLSLIGGLITAAVFYLDSPFDIPAAGLDLATLDRLLFAACWGAFVGGALQFLVQLPVVMRTMSHFKFSFSTKVDGVKETIRTFFPVVAGRGVAQISSYIDLIFASFIAVGALSALRYGVMLYMLPVSLFGMSVAASELPELSRLADSRVGRFLERTRRSLRQIAFLTVPTAVGYLAFGFLIVGAVLRTGQFEINGNWLAYFVLAGYTLGLVATTMSRLLQNAFFALKDTKTPAKIAAMRVGISALVGVPLMFWLDSFALTEIVDIPAAEQPLFLGAVGLAVGASAGAWAELAMLRITLGRKTDDFALPMMATAKMVGLALIATVPALLLWRVLPDWHIALQAIPVVGLYATVYLGIAYALGFDEIDAWVGRFARRFKK